MIDPNMLIDLMQRAIQQASTAPEPPANRWKYCVALAACGRKAIECKKIDSDIIVVWHKEGKQDVEIRLDYNNQCLWLDYLQQKERNNG